MRLFKNGHKRPQPFFYVYVLDRQHRFPQGPIDGQYSLIGVFRHDTFDLAAKSLEQELDVQCRSNWFYNASAQEYQTIDTREKVGYIKKVFR